MKGYAQRFPRRLKPISDISYISFFLPVFASCPPIKLNGAAAAGSYYESALLRSHFFDGSMVSNIVLLVTNNLGSTLIQIILRKKTIKTLNIGFRENGA